MPISLKSENIIIQKLIWIILFIAFSAVYAINKYFVPELNRVDIISIATFNNYDIGAVLKNYNIIFLSFAVLTLAGGYVLSLLYKKYDYVKELCNFLNPLAGIFIILLFFKFIGNDTISYFSYYFLWITAFIIFFSLFRKDFISNREQSLYTFLILAALCFTLGTLTANVNITGSLLLLTITLIIKIIPGKYRTDFYKFLPSIRPLFFLIYIPVIAVEACRILQDRGFNINSPFIAYVILSIIIIASIIILVIRNSRKRKKVSVKNEFYYFVFPVILIGIVLRSIYRPYIENSAEIFELANHANAVVNSLIYHQIPFADYLSSHAMSDTFFQFIYILFHGFNWTTDFMLYHFLFLPFYYIAAYYLFLKAFGKNLIPVLMVLLFPFMNIIMPVGFFLIIFQIFILYKLFRSYSAKNLITLFCITILGILWRFDVGLPMILITIASIIICTVKEWKSKTKRISIIKITGIFALSFLILFIIFYFRSPDTFSSNFRQAIGYLTGNQAHAYPEHNSGNIRMDFYHYTLFPLIGIGIICIIIFGRKFFFSKRNLFISVSIVSLLSAYIFNFQRGVVRHSLYENTDSFTTIFFYLAISLFIYLFIRKYRYSKLAFFTIITFLCFNFKYPGTKGYESLLKKYENNQKLAKLNAGIELNQPYKFDNIKKFADGNFSPEATFIDLSNSPMLYFYFKRKVPSYFCQYMQNTVSFELQKENIKLLDKMEVPFVVFSSSPPSWFDNTDGVPNTLRYYMITKYIYENYKPYYIIDNYEIWIDKTIALEEPSVPHSEITQPEFQHNFILYPYLLGSDNNYKPEEDTYQIKIANNEKTAASIPAPVAEKTCYACINIKSIDKDKDAFLEFYFNGKKYGHIQFRIKENMDNQDYIIPIDYLYPVFNQKIDSVSISIPDGNFDNDNKLNFSIYQK